MTTAYFQDRAPIQQTRKLADGRLAAVARFARSGVYRYSGREVDPDNVHGLRDQASVNVYRAEDEVFSEASMASFAHKAMTLDHPPESVTASNWSKFSVGYTEGRVARDGGFVTIPLILADATAVQAYESGKAKELSAGYSCSLIFGDGVAPDGTPYQARQTNIVADHLALVPAGRAGPQCRIGDAAPKPTNTLEAARKAWANDKANAYRRSAPSAPAVQTRATRDTRSASTPQTIETARQQWLADKSNAYRGKGE